MPNRNPPPVYLVELGEPHTGELESADVTLFLENAIEQCYLHLASFSEPVRVEVRRDRNGHLWEIGFLTRDHGDLLCSISVYRLGRDRLESSVPGLKEAAQAKTEDLEAALNQLFNR